MDPLQLLQQYFGHSTFRTGQQEAIDAILQQKDVLAVMPTGAGKSICYQIPALMLSGITLVISPLISLMQDQVENLRQSGIPAACLNSSMSFEEYQQVLSGAAAGMFRLIYVAPERLTTEAFLRFAAHSTISMITVDEAHCVSQWGQDFRPSYLEIAKLTQQLPQRPILTAFTATATEQVKRDIIQLLGLQAPVSISTGYNRSNLYFAVQRPQNKKKALLDLMRKFAKKSGIVYCSTRKLVEEVCETLQDAGIAATRYHAGLPDWERTANQEEFLYDHAQVMVATNAFGMGIDKSNVSFVIHYNMPKDLESYYQEAGRAGRDGEPAQCILLYSGRDVRTNEFILEQAAKLSEGQQPDLQESLLRKSKERLKYMTFYATTPDCLRHYLLRYFGEEAPCSCGACSNCLAHYEKKDMTLEAKKIISCVYRAAQNRYHLSRTLAASVLTGSKKEVVLQMHLDQLSTYGILSDQTHQQVVQIIDALVADGDLALQPYRDYQALTLTKASAAVLRNEKQVELRLPKKERVSHKQMEETEDPLFQRLREFRQKLADSEEIPSYLIFTNASLRDMCRKKPLTMSEFRQVSGVGVIKSQKYGACFIKEIQAFLAEQEAEMSKK